MWMSSANTMGEENQVRAFQIFNESNHKGKIPTTWEMRKLKKSAGL